MQNLGDIAVAAPEGLRHAVHHRVGRRIAQEESGDLQGDMARRGRFARENIEGLLNLAETGPMDLVAEKHLVAKVVPVRIELEQARTNIERAILRLHVGGVGRKVDAHARQDAR